MAPPKNPASAESWSELYGTEIKGVGERRKEGMREALKKCVIFQLLGYAKDMKVENVILKRKRYVKIKRPLWRISKCLKILVE